MKRQKVIFSDRLVALLSDPEAAKQLRSWMATGKPELIAVDGVTVRPKLERIRIPLGG